MNKEWDELKDWLRRQIANNGHTIQGEWLLAVAHNATIEKMRALENAFYNRSLTEAGY